MAREKPAYPAAASVLGADSSWRSRSAPQSVSAPSPKAVQPAIAPRTTRTAVGPRLSVASASSMPCGATRRSAVVSTGSAQAETKSPAAATRARCGATPSSAAAPPPTSAPPRPPKLNPACSPDSSGRRASASTSTPTALAATLIIPVAAPKTNSATQSAATDDTRPGRAAVSETRTAAEAATGPAPNRAQSPPVTRMQTSAPRDRHSSATPRAVWPAPTVAATSGTREAQLPKTAPSSTNRAVTAARSLAAVAGDRSGRGGNRTGRRGAGIRTRRYAGRVDMGEPLGGRPATRCGGGPRRAGRAHDLGHP